MYEALLKATQEYQKIAASFAKPGPAALFGLPPAGRALLYAALQKDLGRVLCIVTPGEAEATHFADDLKALGLAAAVFPPRDFMLRPVEGAGREYEYRRLSVLGALAGGRLQAVCVPAEALLQYTVPRDEFLKNTLTLKPGMVYNREALVARLFAAGYVRRSQVNGPGQFSVRGDIVDVYAPDMRQPARVEYWDDEIDSMASFDLLTQRRDGALEKIYLSPAREVLFGSTEETAGALRAAVKKARGKHRTALEKATEADLSQLDSGLMPEAMDKYYGIRYPEPATLLDHLDASLFILDEMGGIRDAQKATEFRRSEELTGLLEEGVPALMDEGEVYLSDAFRNLQAAPPKISVGVSVHGSVLDLEVDTGEFPTAELRELLQSLHQKKRYHRLRDGRLLRLDDNLEGLDELNETLELSGAKLKDGHAELPLYRAPTLDWALSGQNGLRFSRDDAFRRISRSFHAVKDSEYTPPQSLHSVLRKYQRDGYRWLRTLDGYGMGGILADDMGLGKTLQVLSYLLALKEGGQPLPSLIVCPASLVLNWEEECKKFTPQLTCVAMDGDAAHRAVLARRWAEADLVVTSYDLLRRDEDRYAEQPFYACILDEAQAIKNHTTQKYKAVCQVRSQVRFALTGTPVENRLGELWSIFSFLMPGYLPPYKNFCARFEKPIVQEEDANAVRRLNQLTGPFILRRMKADVLRELPPKTENVHRIELDTEQRKLYLAAVVDAREKLRAAKPEDKMAVFAVLMRLRQICCDPRLVADNWSGGSAKLDACMELVTAAVEGGHRILLFSQFTSMLDLLAQRLDEAGVSHFTLQGSTPKPVRAELVRRFNAGEASVFLISLRAGGTGLNLTAADIVIHYDPWWNVAAQNQATDRAYRIGQKNPVQVYKLIAQDTIEEKIVELQQAKQSLADTVTGSADGAILSMKPEELLQLLGEEA